MRSFAITMVIALAVLVGAAAIAGAFGGGDSAGNDGGSPVLAAPIGPPVTGLAAHMASTAALRATGPGTVTSVTRDPTGDAAYAVDVNESTGTALIVDLDRHFKVHSVDVLQSTRGFDNSGDGGD